MERLQRILSAAGIASRRGAEELIREGQVTVNGRTAELGSKADPTRDDIRVNGKRIPSPRRRYIVLNKPSGYITTVKDERDRWTVMDLVRLQDRVYPVGRLDRDTEGLLILTNDGDLANRVMHPRYGLEKEYHVLTTGRPGDLQLQRLRDGLAIEGRRVTPHEVRVLRETHDGVWITVSLHEGLHHVVRRMMEIVGIPVEKLRRVRIGPINVAGIPLGGWREMTVGEFGELAHAVGIDTDENGMRVEPKPRRDLETGEVIVVRQGTGVTRSAPQRGSKAGPRTPQKPPARTRTGEAGPPEKSETSKRESGQHSGGRQGGTGPGRKGQGGESHGGRRGGRSGGTRPPVRGGNRRSGSER